MKNDLKDITLADMDDESRPNAGLAHFIVLARSKADTSRDYSGHRAAVRAEILDRDKPLPPILRTDAERHEATTRLAAKSGKTYLESFAIVTDEQRVREAGAKSTSPQRVAGVNLAPTKPQPRLLRMTAEPGKFTTPPARRDATGLIGGYVAKLERLSASRNSPEAQRLVEAINVLCGRDQTIARILRNWQAGSLKTLTQPTWGTESAADQITKNLRRGTGANLGPEAA